MNKFEYVLFDLDGTLTDPKEGITNCVKYALVSLGRTVLPDDELMQFIGPPLEDSFKNICKMDEKMAKEATAKYRERFSSIGIYENKLFDQTDDLLSALKTAGKKVALATSKPTKFAKIIMENFNIIQYFDVIYGSEFDGTRYTKTDVICDVLKEFGIDGEKHDSVVMVGDREYDVIGAKNCNIASIGVRYGYAVDGELEAAGADYIVDTVCELKEFLIN